MFVFLSTYQFKPIFSDQYIDLLDTMPRGGGGRGGGGRGGPSFAKPADPSFIRRIKEQMGYKARLSFLLIM